MKVTEKKLERIRTRVEELVLSEVVHPKSFPHEKESIASEIAHRIIENMKLAPNRASLQKNILIVLNDYRDHAWVNQKNMQSEAFRLGLMERICA